jgi:hypothetical protein
MTTWSKGFTASFAFQTRCMPIFTHGRLLLGLIFDAY